MTRHASRHANSVTLKSASLLKTDFVRNPWLLDRSCPTNGYNYLNIPRDKNCVYVPLSKLGTSELQGNAPAKYVKCYNQKFGSMPVPRLKNYSGCQNTVIPSNHKTISSIPVHNEFCDYTLTRNSIRSNSHISSDKPTTPINVSTDGIVDPCGGHCKRFERFCHYFLQVFFIIGILAGISLVLASYWLHKKHRTNDQLGLVYIGVLMALVSTVLLSIQCSVEREVKRKQKNRRITAASLNRNHAYSVVPMRDLSNNRFSIMKRNQNITHNTCKVSLMNRSNTRETPDIMSRSQNGIPWWRRNDMEVTPKNDNIV